MRRTDGLASSLNRWQDLHYKSNEFTVHPLADFKVIKEAATLTATELGAPEKKELVDRCRRSLVELANNVSKAVLLVAVYGLGATSSQLWTTLCR